METEPIECRDGITGESRHETPRTAHYRVMTLSASTESMWCIACLSAALDTPDGSQVESVEPIAEFATPLDKARHGRLMFRLDEIKSERN